MAAEELHQRIPWQRVIWTYLRPCWQLCIVVLYAVPVLSWPGRAWYTLGGIVFLASNLMLAARIHHPKWPEVLHKAVWVEAVAGLLLGIYMMVQFPVGPASLLLFPTWSLSVVRYRDKVLQTGLFLSLLIFSLWTIYGAEQPHRLGDWNSTPTVQWLLVGLYVVVLAFGVTLTEQILVNRRDREQFTETMARLQAQSHQLSRVNEQVNEYANRVYDLAAAEERNRIAGEIHDNVAHRLTALFVQLQAARRILGQGDTEAAQENLRVCEALAQESLNEVRQSVRAIRKTADTEGISALRRLTLHYASITGMEITFETAVTDAIPAQVMALLYRVIQEGLTNAQRHGRATKVDVTLERSGVYLRLVIQDNGRGSNSPALGFGLSTMRERLRRYGGDIEVTSEPAKGFRLSLRLPIWEGVNV
ncbi:MAG: sensor histidine kinase [Alicyclobacillus herbarius]|uniref:sensor histidine kinase n=1 Tax=Alicyclobacillus herbarius TaxID=122960 RepID=UPI0023552C10|nr:sensor histidine kinase [Alicyclobacillus herbarius]MCL6633603.1 sensor histidine kinase [Alicyclobacillus herbarius]